MGAGSSTEQRSPQDGTTAAGESQPGSPEGQTPTAAEAPEAEQPEDPSKLLHKNGQISSINGITEEQVELSHKPEELKEQQAEVLAADVGQGEATNVILKEESTENMETNLPELDDKSNEDDEQKDTEGANKQLPSEENEEQPGESPSNDVGFKKVFKLVGFKFTVKKDKTEKMEPVQLLNVKAEVTEGSSDGAGDCKELKTETVEEATESEITDFVEKTEEEIQTEEMKEETPERVTEGPVEAESKEAEIKDNGNKSPESPVSPLTSETASPLRKFFTQGWAGFRKRTSFRKPKEEELQTEKEKQEQKTDEVTTEGIAIKEELEKEKLSPEEDRTEVSLEASDEKMESEEERKEETKMVEVSTETNLKEAPTPSEQPSTEVAENINKEVGIRLKGETDLELEEKLEPVQESPIGLEQSTVASSEGKTELGAPLLNEAFEEKISQSDSLSPVTIEKPDKPFEKIEEKSEPKAPLATEIFDENPTEINIDVRTVVTEEEPKTTKKEQLVLEQLVKTNDDFQKEQSTVEQLKVTETVPEIAKEHFRQTDPSNLDAATHKAPEGITSEVELLSSQEKAKMQGSPLKKLFTGTGLKKLSGKKHKGKKEEAKPGEAAEQIQQLSDSAESPDDPRAESSASSPEEITESVEKASDAAQIPEAEEGSPSDVEKKRESVTPWASFKKMVTPKKRVRRLSESDREEELDKTKSATLSSTESAPNDEQEDIKDNDEEQKIEKSADEPKRKVDTSVSWEALICVGSSKKRRKSSSSDEEVGQRLAQDGQKLDEVAPNKEAVHDTIFTNSHESDQGQGNSSPEQVGSPSETEGVSTWESFKRLVTPRRKSKTKMEEKNDEPTTVPSLEHATLDGDTGKEESWVSFKKLMPSRRKKKSDGIPEHTPVQEAGEEMTGTNEEDSDVPAVVPLSEYEAAEQEKFEAQKTEQDDTAKKTSSQNTEKSQSTLIIEQASEGLVHAIAVSVVEGERAVTSIEERSPSWISAAVTESIEHVNEDEKKSEEISGTGIVEETVVVTKLIPHMRKNISGDTIVSELELTSEAVTAREEASGIEETTEISCAEETTEMVSAVSRLSESPDTTEIVTPVQEIAETEQDLEELNNQTQEMLQVVAERIKLSDGKGISESLTEVTVQPLSAEKIGHEISAISKEVELPLNEVVQINEVAQSCEAQSKVKEDGLREVLKKSNGMLVDGKEKSKETTSLELVESHHPKTEQESVKQYEEIIGEQTVEEKSDEEFVIVTVTPEEQPEIEVSDTFGKQQMLLKEMDSEEYNSTGTMQGIIMNLEETTQNKITECIPEVDELEQVTCEEKPQLHQKQEEIQNNFYDTESQPSEIILVEVNEAVVQNEVKDFNLLTESPQTKLFVPERGIQNQLTEVPPSTVKNVAFGTETGSAEETAVEACIQSEDFCTSIKNEAHIQKVGSEVQLQKLEPRISEIDVKMEPFLLYEETQILAETMEKEMSPQVMEIDVHKLNAKAEAQVINDHVEEPEIKSQVQSGEAEVLVEKAELKVDMELSTEKAKTESPTEKVIIEDHLKEEEAQLSAEEAPTKLEREVCQEKIDIEVDVEKIEKVEVRVPEEMVDGTVFVETSTEQMDAKLESGAPVEKADTKVDEEASKKKRDADVEADVPAGKTITESPQDQADAKLNGEIFAMKGDIKSHAENMDAEIAKNESEVLSCLPADTKQLTEGTAAESTTEKTVTELFTEKVMASIEKVETKAGMEVFTEKVDEKSNADVLAEQTATQIPIEQSDEMMVTKAIARELEPKETLQNVMNEVGIQSEVEDSRDSLSKNCDAVVSNEPSRRKEKDAASTVEKPTAEAALEKPSERELLHISAPAQTAMDEIQKYVGDPNLTSALQCTEGISAKASEIEEQKDVMLEESECTEESVIESPVQKELIVLPSVTEAIDTAVSEGLMQNEKEDTLIHLEPQYNETKGAAKTPENEEALNSVKNELGNGKLPIGGESAGKVEGDLLISDSRFIESVVSNAIMEKKRERVLPDLKSEVQEAGMSEISVKTETYLEELPVETVHSPSESKAASESCQGTQQLSGKVQIMEMDKAVQKPELAAGGALYAAPIQELFTEQQEDAGTDIHDLQSYAAYISSVTITAAALEECVIAEHVTLTETSTETFQTLLGEPKEPASKTIQFRSFAHSESGILYPDPDAVAFSEKIDSVIEESVLSAVRCTKEGLLQKCVFDSTLEMELPKSLSLEQSEQKVMTPERSPSTEFPKDVQFVTIESQSSKIVQKIIQTAVDELEQTEEAISPLKQKSEPCLVDVNESGILEDVQVGQQISMAEEKNHEIQPTSVTAEKKEAINVAKEMPLSFNETENGENWSSGKTDADLETVKEIVNETERKNGDSKPQLEVDTAVSTETQKNMLGSIVSGGLPKESLEIEQSTVKDLEVALIVENQEKLIPHQTHRKRKEDCSQSTEFPEMHKEEDFTSCESPQLQTKLRES